MDILEQYQAYSFNFSTGSTSPTCVGMTFNRHGGFSQGVYGSLNTSYGVGDIEENVSANRNAIKAMLSARTLVSARQVHGDQIQVVDEAPQSDTEFTGYDALVTSQKNLALLIQHADCQAVLLYDGNRQVIAAVHNGWRGSVYNILGKTISLLTNRYGSDPNDLQAVISPSLGPCCSEFINHRLELPLSFRKYMVQENYFDFWKISRSQLMESGIPPSAIQLPTTCTRCSDDFFSYRRATKNSSGMTGRNCTAIVLHG